MTPAQTQQEIPPSNHGQGGSNGNGAQTAHQNTSGKNIFASLTSACLHLLVVNSKVLISNISTKKISKLIDIIFLFFQVVVEAGFTPVEEVGRILMEPKERVEKVVRNFSKEGWVGDHDFDIRLSMVDLVEEVEVIIGIGNIGKGAEMGEAEEEEGTPVEAVEIVSMIPAEVVVDLTMSGKISTMNVATTQLVMVR